MNIHLYIHRRLCFTLNTKKACKEQIFTITEYRGGKRHSFAQFPHSFPHLQGENLYADFAHIIPIKKTNLRQKIQNDLLNGLKLIDIQF